MGGGATADVEPVRTLGLCCAMPFLPRRLTRSCVAPLSILALVTCTVSATSLAQRPAAAPSGYKDLAELLQRLPNAAPPALDEQRALWLGALPLSCLDQRQPVPGERRNGTGRGGAAAANSGAGYFWRATYRLISDHDRVRAFWGCSDWHSAVASTWVAVHVLASYRDSPLRDLTREELAAHLGRSNLDGELAFFHDVAALRLAAPPAGRAPLVARRFGRRTLGGERAAARHIPGASVDDVPRHAPYARANRRAPQHRHGDGQCFRLLSRL